MSIYRVLVMKSFKMQNFSMLHEKAKFKTVWEGKM
jgi:hypothetical protein